MKPDRSVLILEIAALVWAALGIIAAGYLTPLFSLPPSVLVIASMAALFLGRQLMYALSRLTPGQLAEFKDQLNSVTQALADVTTLLTLSKNTQVEQYSKVAAQLAMLVQQQMGPTLSTIGAPGAANPTPVGPTATSGYVVGSPADPTLPQP